MERYSATRLALCLALYIVIPAQGQVQVGELVVRPAADGVTVTLAQDEPAEQQPGILPAQQDQPQQEQQPVQAQPVQPAPPRPAVTRITLTAAELPPAQPVQAYSRPLPPLPAPHRHELERDVQTLKAARAAMELEDRLRDRKMASLR